jgi:hypothetical protein|tara:strand:+ start:4885 stop:5259 length:375 start_codon:yes stop_codon:yes gene_type:complete
MENYTDPDFYGLSVSDSAVANPSKTTLKNSTMSSTLNGDTLARLPVELVLLVAELLEPVDFLAFSATCQWLRQMTIPMREKMLKNTIFDPSFGHNQLVPQPNFVEYYNLLDDLVLRFHRDRFQY